MAAPDERRRRGRPEIVAHRGASAAAPEHTVAAYDLALAGGAETLELDLRQTLDGVPVVLHDRSLLRTTGDPRPIDSVRSAELRELPASRRPLTFAAVLARYGRRARYLVELKDPTPSLERRAVAALAATGLRDRAVVQSFDLSSLGRVRRLDRALPVAPLLAAIPVRRDAFLDAIAAGGAAAVGVREAAIDRGLVLAAHRRGLGIRAWTVNEPAAAERLADWGVDGLITDLPERLAA